MSAYAIQQNPAPRVAESYVTNAASSTQDRGPQQEVSTQNDLLTRCNWRPNLGGSSAKVAPAPTVAQDPRNPATAATPKIGESGFMQRLKKLNPFANNASAAGCCTVVSLDEASNALDHVNGQSMHHHDSPVMVPSTKAELIATPIVSVVSMAGVKIASDIIRYQNPVIRDLKSAISENKTAMANHGQTEARLARHKFLTKNLRESQFQKWVAGATSGVGSLAVFLGQFIVAVSPIGRLADYC